MASSTPWALPAAPAGTAAPADLRARRDALHALEALQIMDENAEVSEERIAGIPCVVVAAPGAQATMIYAHGGGFRLGEPKSWAGLASRLAVAAGIRMVLPDYRLAPEHPFPSALQDLVAVYRALSDAVDTPLLLGGDSAGGGLACSLALMARDAGKPASAVALLSPWLDLTVGAASYAECADSDASFSTAAALEAAQAYLAGRAADTPLASPLLHPLLAGFPPLWVAVSGCEVLRDDTLDFAYRIACTGGRVDLCVYPDLPHVWPILQPHAPETARTVRAMAQFLAFARHAAADAPSPS